MKKKNYMKPAIEVVKLQQKNLILAGSQEGMQDNLLDNEVDDAW